MEKCVEKYLKQQIIKKIKEDRNEENFEYKFSCSGVESLIFNYYNGKAYLSCFNDEKGIYFDAIVKWLEKDDKVGLDIEYKEISKKDELGIYNWL